MDFSAAPYGFGLYGYDDGDRLGRESWSEKSDAASRREQAARRAFEAAMAKVVEDAPTAPVTMQLLEPSTHLTQPCWRDFKKHVERYQGWSAKRRAASNAEKQQHGETRKGTCYFVDVTFSPAKAAAENQRAAKLSSWPTAFPPLPKLEPKPAAVATPTPATAAGGGKKRPADDLVGTVKEHCAAGTLGAAISDEAAPDLSKMSVGQINNWLKTLQEKPKPKQPKASAGASSSRFWG